MTESKKTTYLAALVLPEFPGEPIHGGAVTVEGDTITWVGRASELPADAGEIVDFGDNTLMPGLIDTHVHLAFDASDDPVKHMNEASYLERFALMSKSARDALSGGLTTIRDLGAPDKLDRPLKKAIKEGMLRGPRIISVNAPITVTGGHCYFMGGEAETPDGVRAKVREHRRDGAEHIKFMATGGGMTPGTIPAKAQFTQEEMNAIVETAHHYGMKVAAHAHGTEGIERAILAGADSIEHFSFLGEADEDYNAAVLKLAGERRVFASRTISAAGSGRAFFRDMNLARSAVDAGVRVVIGTDAGINNCPLNEIVISLEGHAVYGMTNEEVLIAGTSLAAESLGLEDVTGRLRAGLSADMIVVPGNPLENLSVIRGLSLVIAQGKPYVPEFPSTRTWNDENPDMQYDAAASAR